MKKLSLFRYFKTSPEVLRLTVMMYVRYPLSLRQVEDLLFERGIDICHETVRLWWNRFGLRGGGRWEGRKKTGGAGRARGGGVRNITALCGRRGKAVVIMPATARL